MHLAVVDVGNTSTAIGLWSGGRVSLVQHIDGPIADAQFAVARLIERRKCDAIAYASVVPKVDSKWKAFAKRSKIDLRQVNYRSFMASGVARGGALTIDYPEPDSIGADRFADAAAAVDRYGVPVLVMDFGTALTAAVITPDRTWRGGVIAPGFPLMRDYLFERTAQLPRMKLGGKVPKIGRSTEEAMRFGAFIGYRGMVREIVAELRRNFDCDFKLVATGGFARWALKDIGLDFAVDPSLTLYGVGLICAS